MTDGKLKALIRLLDDSDVNVSSPAMGELLSDDSLGKSLNSVLAELQESSNHKVRRKSHQMQVIQRIRERRRSLSGRLLDNHPNLLQGLAELHSIWYDETESSALSEVWLEMVREAAKYKPISPKRLGYCMRKLGFKTYDDNIQDPDLYCLGAVTEDRIGSDILLVSIALEIGRGFGLRGAVIREDGAFGVLYVSTIKQRKDGKPKALRGTVLSPANNWVATSLDDPSTTEVWSTKDALKYVAGMLFVNAVCSEGPRYVQILGSCLTGGTEHDSLETILPLPFGSVAL